MQRYLNTVMRGWRPCSTILPTTLALAAFAPVRNFFSSVAMPTTSPNVTESPTLPGKVSTLTVSPGATRYCFPPDRITAYITPPDANRKPRLYGYLLAASTKRWFFLEVGYFLQLATSTDSYYNRMNCAFTQNSHWCIS